MKRNLLATSAISAAAGMLTLIAGFVSSVLVARFLGPEANGIVAYSLWLCTTGSIVAELGTGLTLLRVLPQLKARDTSDADIKRFGAYLAIPVILAALVLLGLYTGLEVFTDVLHGAGRGSDIILATGLLFAFQAIGAYSRNYLVGVQRVDLFFRNSVLSAVLQILVIFGALKYGVSGALMGYAAGQFVNFVYTLSLFSHWPSKSGVDNRYLWGASILNFFETAVFSIFLSRLEIFILEKFQGVEMVGYYAIALSLVNLALQLPIQLTGNLVTYYSHRQATENGPVGPDVFTGVVRCFAYLTLPLCFGLAGISSSLVHLFFGQAYAPTENIVAILALGAPLAVLLQLCTQYAFALDRFKLRVVNTCIGAVAMLLVSLMVIPSFAGEGAAIARNLVYFGMCVTFYYHLKLGSTLKSLLNSLARIGLAAAACGAVAYGLSHEISGLTGLVISIPAGMVTYLVMLRLTGAVASQDTDLLLDLSGRLPPALQQHFVRLIRSFAA